MDECSVKRTPIRRVSKKRAATFSARRECVRIVLERDLGCRFWARMNAMGPPKNLVVDAPVCWGPIDVHEPGHRSQGADPTDPDQCVALCRAHHDWVHDHPLRAAPLGL
jgi:hypothetical protein